MAAVTSHFFFYFFSLFDKIAAMNMGSGWTQLSLYLSSFPEKLNPLILVILYRSHIFWVKGGP